VCLAAVQEGLTASAHDCSDGGLAVALAESCIWGRTGAEVALPDTPGGVRLDARLFGESPSRIVISARPENVARIEEMAAKAGAPLHVLGEVGGEALTIEVDGRRQVSEKVAEMARIWREAIPALMGQ